MTQRSHPFRELLDAAATGHIPTNEDLDATIARTEAGVTLDLTSETKRSLRAALRTAGTRAAELKSQGQNGAARKIATDTADELADVTGDWTAPRESLDGLGPRELAARIPRRG